MSAGEDRDPRPLDARAGRGPARRPAIRRSPPAGRASPAAWSARPGGAPPRSALRGPVPAGRAGCGASRRKSGPLSAVGRSSRARTILYSSHHDQSQHDQPERAPYGGTPAAAPRRSTSGCRPSRSRPRSSPALKLDVGAPRWPLADVLPVLPFIGAGVGLAAGLVFAIVRGLAGPGWLAGVLAVGAAVLITRALHEDGLADTADGLGPHALEPRAAAGDHARQPQRHVRRAGAGALGADQGRLPGAVLRRDRPGRADRLRTRCRARCWPIRCSPSRRCTTDGLGAQAGKPTDNDVWLTIGIGAALAFLLLLGKGFFVAMLAPIAAIAAAWFASRWIAERIGGYTGDTLGAVQQKAEIAFLVVAALSCFPLEGEEMATAPKITGAVTRWWWVRHAPVPNPEAAATASSTRIATSATRRCSSTRRSCCPRARSGTRPTCCARARPPSISARRAPSSASSRIDPDLAEQHFGDWQGLTYVEIAEKHGDNHLFWLAAAGVPAAGRRELRRPARPHGALASTG